MSERKAYLKKYLKAWLERHPHYHRDWMRVHRGVEPDAIGRKRERKVILGVPVNWKWVSR